jgi:hypothetical protein
MHSSDLEALAVVNASKEVNKVFRCDMHSLVARRGLLMVMRGGVVVFLTTLEKRWWESNNEQMPQRRNSYFNQDVPLSLSTSHTIADLAGINDASTLSTPGS